ncbi:MAG: LamG-like jellyroll fold domain-containing protein, partial [Verrucomicrobiota bacterium]
GEQYDLDINANKFRIVTRFPAASGTPPAVALSSAATVSTNWQHVIVAWDGTKSNMTMYVNGQASQGFTSTTANLAAVVPSATPITIGARQSASGPYNLYVTNTVIDEVRFYNRTLTAADAYELFSFGGFGNPNGTAPVVTTQPRSVTNYVGDIAAFSVAASGIPASFYYQWLSNNVIIPNATNTTLVLTNVQLSWSASYSVFITNIIGSVTSAPANLQVQSLPAANITAGLVGYWKFDDASGSSTAADSSGNGNPGTLSAFNDFSSVWVTGITNGALNFNADASTANVVAIPNVGTPGPSVLDFSTSPAFTLATWVKTSSLTQSNGAGIICHGSGGGGEQYNLDLPTAGYRFFVRNSAGAAFLLNTTVKPNGTWQHLVAVFDAVNGIQNLYVNGQLVGVTVAPTSISTNASTHEVSIGNRQSAAAAYNLPFTGAIDDTRVYSRALTSSDVAALYLTGGVYPPTFATQPQGATRYVADDVTFSAVVGGTLPISYQWRKNGVNIPGATNTSLTFTNLQLTNSGSYTLFASNGYNPTALSDPAVLQVNTFVLTNSLAGYWKFDEGMDTTINDSSTNLNQGFIAGSDYQWVAGRIGRALNLNTTDRGTYVLVPDSPSLNLDTGLQFTLSTWVRGSAAQISGAGLMAKGYGAGGEQFSLDLFSGVFRFYVRNSAAVASVLMSSVAPSGFWQHVVATFDATTGAMRLYVNGQLVGSATGPTSLFATTHELSIGNRESGNSTGYNLPFVGMMDDVRIYNRPLNAFDVQQLFASAGPFAPVIYSVLPASGSVLAGDNINFAAAVDGDPTLGYQWAKGPTVLSTNAAFTLSNVKLSDAGTYTFQVSNGAGSVSSNVVVSVQAVPAPNLVGDLIAYWTFDETNGFTAADSSTNANTVSLVNFAGDDTQWIAGRIGGALHLNANGLVNNQYAQTDNPLTLQNGNQFSFSFWAKLDDGVRGFNPRFITPTSTHWVLWTPGRGVGLFTPAISTEPSSNAWTHYVVVFDRSLATYSLYVNGNREVAGASGYARPDPTGLAWVIGHSETTASTSDSWTGSLDEMRIYNRLLNVNEAKALYYFAGGQPSLSIERNGNSITLSWSAGAAGYQLQSTDALGNAAVWSNVSGTPTGSADGLTQTFTLTADSDAKFYRLQK